MVPAETEWEAKELILETVRAKKDPAARPELEKAYATETDEQEKGKIKAALLELDNPGRCVAEDEGRPRLVDPTQMDAGNAVRSLECERRHCEDPRPFARS